jgi:uncharacterized membrane-anchored protein
MHGRHLPALGRRFWVALCLASIFGANMGDFFAHNLGLGHVRGLPFLAAAFAVVLVVERFDRLAHQGYYWLAIIIVRTAATNLADFMAGDMKLPRLLVMAGLTVLLVVVVTAAWMAWRRSGGVAGQSRSLVLRADTAYWVSMLVAGTLGTVMGDYFSHNLHLGDGGGAVVLSAVLAGFFLIGARGLIWSLPFYWATVVMVRAAGTCVGDFLAQRSMLGLALSTAVTGVAFAALLRAWREAKPDAARRAA